MNKTAIFQGVIKTANEERVIFLECVGKILEHGKQLVKPANDPTFELPPARAA